MAESHHHIPDSLQFNSHINLQAQLNNSHLRKNHLSDNNDSLNEWNQMETVSNLSNYSNLSDHHASNLSSFSEVSGYEEEFCRIKTLLDFNESPKVHSSCTKKKSNKILDVSSEESKQIKDLTCRLEDAIRENELLKVEAHESNLKTEFTWREKCHEALRHKAQCEGKLEALRKQIEVLTKSKETLLENFKSNELNFGNQIQNTETVLHEKIKNLVRENSEIKQKLDLALTEIKTWKNEVEITENTNKNLNILLQETKLDLESKISSVQGLKKKISEQYTEVQLGIQEKTETEALSRNLKNELAALKKSEKWYSEQLHECQHKKNNLQKELIEVQSEIIKKSHECEKLKIENVHLKTQCSEVEKTALKEKQQLLRQLELIEAEILERETVMNNLIKNRALSVQSNSEIQSKCDLENYDIIINELEEKVIKLENYIRDKNDDLEKLEQQNKQLIINVTTLQKTLDEREVEQQVLEENIRNINIKYEQQSEKYNSSEKSILELKNEKTALEIALNAANIEKKNVDEAINSLRNDIYKITQNYEKMKHELQEKDKQISSIEQEKQDDFMKNNWRVCELEHLQQRIIDSKIIEANLMEFKNLYNVTNIEKNTLNSENEALKNTLHDIRKEKICLENNLSEIKTLLETKDNILLEQLQQIQKLNSEIAFEKNIVKKLLTEKENLLLKYAELDNTNNKIVSEMNVQNSQLAGFNLVLEQYNSLCKTLENDKIRLLQQIQKLSEDESVSKNNDFNCKLIKLKTDMNRIVENISKNISENYEIIKTEHDIDEIIQLLDFVDRNVKTLIEESIKYKDVIKVNEDLQTQLKDFKNENSDLQEQFSSLQLEQINNSNISIDTQTDENYDINEIFTLKTENRNLKTKIQINDLEFKEKYKRYEKNIRTLLKKVKEHMRARKIAEKELKAIKEIHVATKIEAECLKRQLEDSERACNKFRDKLDIIQETVLTLEREIGKNQVKDEVSCEDNLLDRLRNGFHVSENRLKQAEEDISSLEQKLRLEESNVNDLKKQLFTENHENSVLKKQVTNLQTQLDFTKEQLEIKKKVILDLESIYDGFKDSKVELNEKLLQEQKRYNECLTELEICSNKLVEAESKKYLLEDEIEVLNSKLNQKIQSLADVNEQYELSSKQWRENLNILEKEGVSLQKEKDDIQLELKSALSEKYCLQQQCTELKLGLHNILEQNKAMKNHFEVDTNFDLLKSLPSPAKYDDSQIAELVKESSSLSENSPLAHLKDCLEILKQEMTTLQIQVSAKMQKNI